MMNLHLLLVLALCALMAQPAQAQAELKAARSDSLSEQLVAMLDKKAAKRENPNLRMAKKVAAGTVSSIVFTAIGFVGVGSALSDGSYSDDGLEGVGFLLFGAAIGSSVGFPIGVTLVDPYDSLPLTLLAGVIPGSAGYFLLRADHEKSDTAFFLMYVVPVISSLMVSEIWHHSPQDRRVSFGLSPTLNGGFSTVTTLRF